MKSLEDGKAEQALRISAMFEKARQEYEALLASAKPEDGIKFVAQGFLGHHIPQDSQALWQSIKEIQQVITGHGGLIKSLRGPEIVFIAPQPKVEELREALRPFTDVVQPLSVVKNLSAYPFDNYQI